jgi:hypothetical protein
VGIPFCWLGLLWSGMLVAWAVQGSSAQVRLLIHERAYKAI